MREISSSLAGGICMHGPVQRLRRRASRAWLAAIIAIAPPAWAQPPTIRPQAESEKVQTPDLAEPVLKLLDAPYLTDRKSVV